MRLVLAVSAFLIVSHAAGATDAVFPSSAGNLKVQTVASGLVHPWSLAFLPDGRMLVAERPGRLRIIAADGRLSPPLGNVPKVYAVSQAGLMDILLARDFAQSRTIFVCYAEAAEGGGRIAVLRARLIEDESPRLDDVTVIFRQKGPVSRGLNIGCRMVQAQDDNLFVTLGDHFGPKELAQKLDNHIGKIVRITPDGAAPADNPFIGNRGALPEIWAYGLRNAQGLVFNPADGKLWEQEHGPMGGDEINIIEKAQNYGWPRVSYGVNYDGTPVGSGKATMEGVTDPIWHEKITTEPFTTASEGEKVYLAILALSPQNEIQRSLQARAVQVANDVAQTRLLLFVETDNQIPIPFLAILVFWLFIIFLSFSLFSDLNATALAFLCIFGLSASCAIYLILEMNDPFNGLMRISDIPLRNALAPL